MTPTSDRSIRSDPQRAQFLLNKLVFKHDARIPKIVSDVCGCRQQAREQLIKRAKETAEKVRRWGRPRIGFHERIRPLGGSPGAEG